MRKARENTLWRLWRWVRPLILVAVVVCAFRSAVADWNDVPSGSMTPTILEGDRILVNKLAYDLKLPFTTRHLAQWGDPARGDVVVLYDASGTRLVKRVIGVPSDVVELRGDRLFVNDTPAQYELENSDHKGPGGTVRLRLTERMASAAKHTIFLLPGIGAPHRNFGPITVPAGQYFCMGDNRDLSRDSRFFGFIPRSQIVGRVRYVAISLDPNDYYLPRWNRWGRAISE
jgi:signal peptidase I